MTKCGCLRRMEESEQLAAGLEISTVAGMLELEMGAVALVTMAGFIFRFSGLIGSKLIA